MACLCTIGKPLVFLNLTCKVIEKEKQVNHWEDSLLLDAPPGQKKEELLKKKKFVLNEVGELVLDENVIQTDDEDNEDDGEEDGYMSGEEGMLDFELDEDEDFRAMAWYLAYLMGYAAANDGAKPDKPENGASIQDMSELIHEAIVSAAMEG
mgnify:CR=1 FL=1